ncbi:DNA methyltransferase [Corynebacterium glyciniphilum AJ 3170]|uniref:site-specific DNA-methyltransferase (adenine-specific) n=1 Tax=Corynebacterium glyciniphilum AJ 3170 TaxID=1404245 RepID=X5EG18_9CORY|nr:DNA methyltransferase [Corynebacterium glyciniphilum]AHW65556.1 DNA methyltransferase [Corynebacterium glyciniphilum AJ 3170]
MTLSPAQKKRAARDFAAKWKGRGNENEDTQSFWLELLRDVIGMEDVTTAARFEQSTVDRGYIDVVIADAKTFIEQKSLGIDLDKAETRQGRKVTPFHQAKAYADSMPNTQRPDTIIVCDFNEFRIHDLANTAKPGENYTSFTLDELPDYLYLLDFLVDPQRARRVREQRVSLDAGSLIGQLYHLLSEQYIDPETEENQHALNVLCVRLVFCLFAEDAGLFPKDAFYHFLQDLPANRIRPAIKDLFAWLDTPEEDRDPYASDAMRAFPYVNGGLFRGSTEVPPFTDEIKQVLLDDVSKGTDWASISPTIFGGVFESTLNPETRHAGGMHYTSPENIHKVIDPLYLDQLTDELDNILTAEGIGDRKRRNQLNAFHEKLAGLTFFDPACGSGNFLTETYISLRRLENKVISEKAGNQAAFGFEDIGVSPVKVSLRQFYGLEINDFAVSVAETALWIAELQANIETETIVARTIDDLPLRDAAKIVHANALQTDWSDVVAPAGCSYIIGNPPFLGARNQSKEQKQDVKDVFTAIGASRNIGNVDFVAAWYAKAADYIGDHPVRCAFVSTNSICQGEQVANIWSPIWDLGVQIDFAHDTFRWANEATDQANVFCVIVGFSKHGGPKRLFHYKTPDSPAELQRPAQLNAYLADAPDAFIWNRSTPICDVPKIGIGNKPIDGGNYLFTAEEKDAFLVKEPGAEKFFHQWMGSQEFIRGIERWVLWLGDAKPSEVAKMPTVMDRVRAVRDFRLASKSAPTQKLASTPMRFHVENMPEGNSILIPQTSSQRRKYIPLGYVHPGVLCSNGVRLIPNATLYHFGVLHSQFHMAWMRRTTGRLKSDYQYAANIVYNNFVWPDTDDSTTERIEAAAQAVLDARAEYPDSTISDMYDPDNDFLYPALTKAHQQLDDAVEAAYGIDSGGDETVIFEHLMELYTSATT